MKRLLEISPAALLATFLLAAPSCEDADEPPGTLGDPCSDSMDCADDLFCAEGGIYAGHCTEECGSTQLCQNKYGEDTFCHVALVCVDRCMPGVCPGRLVCDEEYTNHCQAASYPG